MTKSSSEIKPRGTSRLPRGVQSFQTRACLRGDVEMAFSGGGPNSPQMNVTPLIDVLLVLIIIFMVVVIEQRPTGLNAEIPQPAPVVANIPLPNLTIVIRVHRGKSDEHPDVMVNEES